VALQSIGLMKKQCRVEVVDSQWAVMAQGFIAMAAAKAARAGASFDEVLDIARHAINRVDMRAAFDTIEYLERGGRIGKAQAFLGSLLKGNPVIGMKDGEAYPYARERSRAKAIGHLYNFAASFGNVEGLAVEYATDFDEANRLFQRSIRSTLKYLFTSRGQVRLSARTQGLASLLLACLEIGRPLPSDEQVTGLKPSYLTCLDAFWDSCHRRFHHSFFLYFPLAR